MSRRTTAIAKNAKRPFCSFAAPDHQAVRQHDSVDRTCARCRNAVDRQLVFFKETIEHAPGEGPMAASSLQR